MKKFIKNIVKKNKIVYNLYYFLFSFLLKIIGKFIKKDKDLVLFVCYAGRKYDDSTRVLYEYIKSSKEYQNLRTIWAFVEPEKYDIIANEEKIKIDTIKYYITALKAKYWITNSSVLRGLNFKNKNTKYVVFQHGTLGIKKLGKDLETKNKSFRTKQKEPIDMFIIQGKKEKDLLVRALELDENKIYELGLPRNDEFVNVTKEKKEEYRRKFNIPEGKKVILYAPTYREFSQDKLHNTILKPPFEFNKLKEELSEEYVLLITAHYEVSKLLNIPHDNQFVINAFEYPYINDLLIVSDILISDYSSIVFDYSILEKPILCFAYDYDIYMEERGTYTDLNELFYDGVIKTQEELISTIKNLDYDEEVKHTKKIKEEYINKYGNTVSEIAKEIFKS